MKTLQRPDFFDCRAGSYLNIQHFDAIAEITGPGSPRALTVPSLTDIVTSLEALASLELVRVIKEMLNV